jgi:hypothetical protein
VVGECTQYLGETYGLVAVVVTLADSSNSCCRQAPRRAWRWARRNMLAWDGASAPIRVDAAEARHRRGGVRRAVRAGVPDDISTSTTGGQHQPPHRAGSAGSATVCAALFRAAGPLSSCGVRGVRFGSFMVSDGVEDELGG